MLRILLLCFILFGVDVLGISCYEEPSPVTGLTCSSYRPCDTCAFTCKDLQHVYGYDCRCTCFTNTRTIIAPSATLSLPVLETEVPLTPTPYTSSPTPQTLSPTVLSSSSPTVLSSSSPTVLSSSSPTVPIANITFEGPAEVSADQIEQSGVLFRINEINEVGFSQQFLSSDTPHGFISISGGGPVGSRGVSILSVEHLKSNTSSVVIVIKVKIGTVDSSGEDVQLYVNEIATNGKIIGQAKLSLRVKAAVFGSSDSFSVVMDSINGGRSTQGTAAAASIMTSSGSAASSFAAIALSKFDCLGRGKLSTLLHPTQFIINNNEYVGCAVMQAVLSVAVLLIQMIVAMICYFASSKINIPIAGANGKPVKTWTNACAAVRFPAFSIIGCLICFPGLVLCSFRVLFTAANVTEIFVGILCSTLALLYPMGVAYFMWRARIALVFKKDSTIKPPLQYLVGPGEWCNANGTCTRQRAGVLFHEVASHASMFTLAIVVVILFLGITRAIPAHGETRTCALSAFLCTCVFMCVSAIVFKYRPRHRLWDSAVLHFEYPLQGLATLFEGFGYARGAPSDDFCFKASSMFLLIVTLVVMIRTVLDLSSQCYILLKNRRSRLQSEVDGERSCDKLEDDEMLVITGNDVGSEETSGSDHEEPKTQEKYKPLLLAGKRCVTPVTPLHDVDNDYQERKIISPLDSVSVGTPKRQLSLQYDSDHLELQSMQTSDGFAYKPPLPVPPKRDSDPFVTTPTGSYFPQFSSRRRSSCVSDVSDISIDPSRGPSHRRVRRLSAVAEPIGRERGTSLIVMGMATPVETTPIPPPRRGFGSVPPSPRNSSGESPRQRGMTTVAFNEIAPIEPLKRFSSGSSCEFSSTVPQKPSSYSPVTPVMTPLQSPPQRSRRGSNVSNYNVIDSNVNNENSEQFIHHRVVRNRGNSRTEYNREATLTKLASEHL